jgi:uncharacterized protein (DUF433 family)
MNLTEFGRYLVMDPRIRHGKLTFKGTRVPVETILNRVAKGRTLDEILVDWPELSRDGVAEAIQLAVEALLQNTAKVAGKPYESTHLGRPSRRARSHAFTKKVDNGAAPKRRATKSSST